MMQCLTVTEGSNGNEENGVTATRRGDMKHNIIDILSLL